MLVNNAERGGPLAEATITQLKGMVVVLEIEKSRNT
jgi:hypothetical protein